MPTSSYLAYLTFAVFGVIGGVAANWVSKPKKLPTWGVLTVLLVVVIASSSFTYYVSRPENTPVVNITQPGANSFFRSPTSVRGTLRGKLAAGHRLWMANKAADENNLHPHEAACNVLHSTWTCTELFLGGPKDPKGKLFDVMVYDVDEQAAKDLKHYGERPKGNYDGLGGMPDESQLVAYVTVRLAT